MNILIDKLPNEFEGLKIDTNFRSFILFELLMQDSSINEEDKLVLSLNLFYKEIPKDIKKAYDGIIWFYTMGNNDKKNSKKKKKESNKSEKIYSYEYDADLIYSAFLKQYHIDLNEIDYLHWFKFKSLFEGLDDDNRICQIMSYRAIDLSKIKDNEQKKKYKKLKMKYMLPDNRTDEEKENDFADALW